MITAAQSTFDITISNVELSELVPGNYTKSNVSCLSHEFSQMDIYEFVNSDSFIKSLLFSTRHLLPNWLSLRDSSTNIVRALDQKTELLNGHEVQSHDACKNAPVIRDRLYSVFTFSSDLKLAIYQTEILLSSQATGINCLIIEDSNMGKTMFLTTTRDTQMDFTTFPIIQHIRNRFGLTIIPSGLATSQSKGISVHHHTQDVEFWNGDHFFSYQ